MVGLKRTSVDGGNDEQGVGDGGGLCNQYKGGVIGVRQVMVDFKRTRIDERNDQSRVGDC